MNEIIKGMANASEAIQENFEEQGEKITAVEENIEFLNFSDSLSTITGVTNLTALKMGRLHMITFMYKPTSTGFTTNVISDIPAAYRPVNSIAASVGTQDSTPDSAKGISAVLRPTGGINVVAPTAASYDLTFSFVWIA